MNSQLQEYARKTLKEGLYKLAEDDRMRFKKMYAHGNLDWCIEDVVDKMEEDRLDWAMRQVQRSIDIKEKQS